MDNLLIEKRKKINYILNMVLFTLVVSFSIGVLLYAFGFSTNWQQMEVFITRDKKLIPLFDKTQAVNNSIVFWALLAMIAIIFNIAVGSHNRKRYYFTNYLGIGLQALFMLICSTIMIISVVQLIDMFQISFVESYNSWDIYFSQINRAGSQEAIIGSLTLGYFISGLGFLAVILNIIMIVNAALSHKVLVEREAYVKEQIEKINSGLIDVEEKTVTQVPSVDDEINLNDQEEISFDKKIDYEFYKKHKVIVNIALVFAVLFTLLFIGVLVGSFMVKDIVNPLTQEPIMGSFLNFLRILLVLLIFISFIGIQKIISLTKNLYNKFELQAFGIYFLIAGGLVTGILLLVISFELPKDQHQAQRMRYQKNGFGFNFAMASLVFFLWSLFTSITYSPFDGLGDSIKVVPDSLLAIEIALCIFLLLITFLAAEKVKAYSVGFSWVMFGIAAVNFARIFILPLRNYQQNQLPGEIFIQVVIGHVICSLLLFFGALVSLTKSLKVKHYVQENGGK